jgi:hypothetical protein
MLMDGNCNNQQFDEDQQEENDFACEYHLYSQPTMIWVYGTFRIPSQRFDSAYLYGMIHILILLLRKPTLDGKVYNSNHHAIPTKGTEFYRA